MHFSDLIEHRLYKPRNSRFLLVCKEEGALYTISILNGYVRRLDSLDGELDLEDYGKYYSEVF